MFFLSLFPEIIMEVRIFVETYAYVTSDSEGVEGRRESQANLSRS